MRQTTRRYLVAGALALTAGAWATPARAQTYNAAAAFKQKYVTDLATTQGNEHSGGTAADAANTWQYGSLTAGDVFAQVATFTSSFPGIGGATPTWSTSGGLPAIGYNNTGGPVTYGGTQAGRTWETDKLLLHPATPQQQRAIIRFTAAVAGGYTVSGKFKRADTGNTKVLVAKTDSGDLFGTWNNLIVGNDELGITGVEEISFAFVTNLLAGQTLNFVVSANGNEVSDGTMLDVDMTRGGFVVEGDALPEPASLSLLLGGIPAFLAFRRKRKAN